MSKEIVEQVKKLVAPIFLEEEMECVDIEYRRESNGWVLRLYIDKEGGVTLDDCTRISQKVGRTLDIEDCMETSYRLEVSSPGLTRPLKTLKDFQKSQNRLIKISTSEPIENQRLFRGKLLRVMDGGIEVEADKRNVYIPFENIAKARLELEF